MNDILEKHGRACQCMATLFLIGATDRREDRGQQVSTHLGGMRMRTRVRKNLASVAGQLTGGLLALAVILGGEAVPASANGEKAESALSVSAIGMIEVDPDTAVLTFAVESAGKLFSEVQQDNASKMQRVMQHVREAGIAQEDIQTSGFDITPQYAPRTPRTSRDPSVEPQPPQIIGYTARNTLTVRVKQPEMAGKVVDQALKGGANRFSGVEWTLWEKDAIYRQALEKAAKEAQHKAQTLAKALGVNLTRLSSVQEGGAQVYPRMQPLRSAPMAMAESAVEVPLAAGKIQVQASVTLVYEISARP